MNHRLRSAAPATAAAIALLAVVPEVVGAPPSCTGDDLVGQCNGTTAVWCENSTRYEVDCQALGLTCGWDESNEWWSCIDADPGGGCPGGITWEGLCASEALLVWCENAQVRSMLCPSGTTCAWDDEQGFFDCVATDALGEAPASNANAEAASAPGARNPVDAGGGDASGDAARPESALPERAGGDWAARPDPGEATTSPVPTAPVGSRPPGAPPSEDAASAPNHGDADAATSTPRATAGGCAATRFAPGRPALLLLLVALGAARLRRRAAGHRPPVS